MANKGEATSGTVMVGCKVLPMWRESGMVDGAMRKMLHGKKAVARVKELLRRAAQPRHPHATASKTRWKKVLSFQSRDGGSGSKAAGDDMGTSKLSFKWDAGSCSSASSSALYSSPLSAVSAPSSQQLWSSREGQRMAHWITSDSDFVVLEL